VTNSMSHMEYTGIVKLQLHGTVNTQYVVYHIHQNIRWLILLPDVSCNVKKD
jgi:hypothetical protein